MLETPTAASTQVILVALADLRDPDWNPRPFLDEAEMPSLVSYVASGRPTPLIEILMAPDQPGPWDVISGKRRCEAYRRAGKTHIEAVVRNVPLEEAKFMAIAANKDDKPFWLGEFIAVNNLKKGVYGEQAIFARKLGWTEKRVSKTFNLTPLLNPATRDLIFQSSRPRLTPGKSSGGQTDPEDQEGPTWRLTEKVACRLIPLWDKEAPEASQARAEKAVRTIIDQQLTAAQTDDLVAHTLAGNDSTHFKPAAKVRKQRFDSPQAKPFTSSAGNLPESQPDPLVTDSADKPVNLPLADYPAPAGHHHSTPASASAIEPESQTEKPGLFWQWMVGIQFISQLRSKVKKGEALTLSEKMLVGFYRLYEWALKPVGKRVGKVIKWVAKGIWDSLKKAFGKVFGKTVEVILPWIIVAVLVWCVIKGMEYGFVYPWRWVETKIHSIFHHADSPTEPTPVPAASTVSTILPKVEAAVTHLGPKKKTEKPSASTSVIGYQPSIAFNTPASPSDASPVSTLYDPKLLEQEIAAVPNNAIITAFPISPDEGIPGDLAVTRLQDTMDTDKYTLWIGGGQYKISSITATTTNLIINCKSTDAIGSFFNNGGMTATLIWEDMLYIHTDEIDIPGKIPRKFFHCTLVGEGAKNALTFRCNSADDLKHLVSALQYFIRNSRLGHDTPLTGMPYPTQGFYLNNHWVEKLWAGSPMDRAGVRLNDLVWSLDKDTQGPQDNKKLKARLDSLASGAYPLFIYSPAASDNLGVDQNEFHTGNFSPKRRKVVLTAD